MSPKIAAIRAGLTVIAFFGLVAAPLIVPQLIYLHDLANANLPTQGEIIETHPEMHSTCKYRYSVGGQLYEQTGRSCGDDRVGQQITVYFSPDDPSKSVNERPSALFMNDLLPFVLALTIFPILAATLAYHRARREVVSTSSH